MLIALLADVHANKPAFSACLADARAKGAQRYVLLGDLVGYGAEPQWCVETAIQLVAEGAVAVLGNHDSAIGNTRERLNIDAQVAIEWTRGELGAPERQFLAGLPLTSTNGDQLYVHAEASAPQRWHYVASAEDAARSMNAVPARVTFCGHIHQPAIYGLSGTAKLTAFTPVSGAAVPLLAHRRWLVVAGSVGQPRDGNPAAAYCLFDTDRGDITFVRVPYDIELAAAAIRAKGLPARFASRLFVGG